MGDGGFDESLRCGVFLAASLRWTVRSAVADPTARVLL